MFALITSWSNTQLINCLLANFMFMSCKIKHLFNFRLCHMHSPIYWFDKAVGKMQDTQNFNQIRTGKKDIFHSFFSIKNLAVTCHWMHPSYSISYKVICTIWSIEWFIHGKPEIHCGKFGRYFSSLSETWTIFCFSWFHKLNSSEISRYTVDIYSFNISFSIQ